MSIRKILSNYILTDGLPYIADLEKSHGSWLVDKENKKEYLDCYSCHAAQPLGWNYPALDQYQNELRNVFWNKPCNSDLYTEEYANFVECFSQCTPDFSHYFFIDTGTLAIENAIKAAFDWKAQKLKWDNNHEEILDIMHFDAGFHGRSGYALSCLHGINRTKWFPKFAWSRLPAPENNNEDIALRQAEKTMKTNKVAAVVIETIASEGGDKHYRKEFFEKLKILTDKYECLLIFDEIQCGMGLTGKMWAYEHFGVVPDLMTFGKKTQVAGFCSTKRIDEIKTNVFNVSGRINSTWAGNLIDMIRCKVFLKIIHDENLVDNAANVGEYLKNRLNGIGLSNLRGRGLMIAFDFNTTNERDSFLNRLSEKMIALPCGNNSVRLRPHLTFRQAEADCAVEFIRKAL